MTKQETFYRVWGKRAFDLLLTSGFLLIFWPLLIMIGLAIRLESEGPVLFKQKRVGKNGKLFLMYKFRTMVKNAEQLKKDYLNFNEADGPVFKIKDDPRFTKVGKYLAWVGLDELPQFINVLKGEMSIVGPRPLPINESKQIVRSKAHIRISVLPGMTSPWVISGAHNLSFQQWMDLDIEYVRTISLFGDVRLLLQTIRLVIFAIFRLVLSKKHDV